MNMDLNVRMKENYEYRSQTCLTRRIPCIIRVDGKNFSRIINKWAKPFDDVMNAAMEYATLNTAREIQGCQFCYTSSDEASFLVRDDFELNTDAYFNYNVQKITSIVSSMFTYHFNWYMNAFVDDMFDDEKGALEHYQFKNYDKIFVDYVNTPIYFDCRCFNIPKEEVCNYFCWRQQDSSRNSIYSLARSLYSHKELQGLNGKQLQDKMFTEKGVNWNDISTRNKRGMCYYKGLTVEDRGWNMDLEIPIFTQERKYIEKFL